MYTRYLKELELFKKIRFLHNITDDDIIENSLGLEKTSITIPGRTNPGIEYHEINRTRKRKLNLNSPFAPIFFDLSKFLIVTKISVWLMHLSYMQKYM